MSFRLYEKPAPRHFPPKDDGHSKPVDDGHGHGDHTTPLTTPPTTAPTTGHDGHGQEQ